MRVLTAGPGPGTRPSARSGHTGTRPGWLSPPRSFRQQAGRCPGGRPGPRGRGAVGPRVRAGGAAHQLAHLPRGCEGGRGAEGGEPVAAGRHGRAKVAVQPERSLARRRRSTSWPGRSSISRSPRWPRAARWRLSTASATGTRWAGLHNRDREILEDMDQLPFVTPVYKRDLRIEDTTSATSSTRTSRCTPGGGAGRGARSACGRRRWAATGTGPAAWRASSPRPRSRVSCSRR